MKPVEITPGKNVILPLKDYQALLYSHAKLSALDQNGVDNWEWYDDSLDAIDEILASLYLEVELPKEFRE